MGFRCWLFGCEGHPQDPAQPEYLECVRCGEHVSYSDMVGDTRWYRLTEWVKRLIASIFPPKCPFCGHRRTCDESIDHIPF